MGRDIFSRADIKSAYRQISGLCGNVDYGVLAMAFGIALYFAWPYEPNILTCLVALAALSLVWGVLRGLDSPNIAHIQFTVGLAICVLLGASRATWHTDSLNYPILDSYERNYDVKGWITAVEKSGPRLRWVVKPQHVSGLDADKLPRFIRVTTSNKDFLPGQAAHFSARLSAPPGPVLPGGYSPAQRAYFESVGAYGYMVSQPRRVTLTMPSGLDGAKLKISAWRYRIADKIKNKAPSSTAGLQVALLTGIRTYVPEAQTQALRASGLAHVLAISGLHMGFTAGAAYYLAALGFAFMTPLSRRYDMRKFAAIIGALIATAYLILSGGSVATQRAYIMALIVFLALILNRRAMSLRSVSLAALVTLCIHPEALVTPGFQMSFAAVTALIITYQFWDSLRTFHPRRGYLARLKSHLTSLSITSLVAGLATSGFALLHFNRVATYSLLGNLLAMPIFTFWVMPAAFLVFVAMPFGLESVPLWIMGQGLELIVNISTWIESWPGSVAHVSSAPAWIIGVYGLAFTALCLASHWRTRSLALCVAIASLSAHFITPIPDMRVAEDGSLALWNRSAELDKPEIFVDNPRKDKFGREKFIQEAGLTDIPVIDFSEAKEIKCDPIGCRLSLHGQVVSVIYDPVEIEEDCARSALVIAPHRTIGARAKRLCAVQIIDARDLKKYGAHSISLGKDGQVKFRRALSPSHNRPWHART